MSLKLIRNIRYIVISTIIESSYAMDPQENRDESSLVVITKAPLKVENEVLDLAFKGAVFPPELCDNIIRHYSGSILDLALVCKKFDLLLKECCCVDDIYYSDEDLLSRPNLLAYKFNFKYPINFDLLKRMKNLTYLNYHDFEFSIKNRKLSILNLTNSFYENFRNLRNFTLVYVVGVSIEALEKMPNLEVLTISNILSDYSDIPENENVYGIIDPENSLQALGLTPISDKNLGRLTQLRKLCINNADDWGDTVVDPSVVQFSGAAIQYLINLEELVLIGCQIKDSDLRNLKKLKHFSYRTGYELSRGFDPIRQRMNYENVTVQLTHAGLSQLTALESLYVQMAGDITICDVRLYLNHILIPTIATLWQYNLKQLREFSLPEKNFMNRHLMSSQRYIYWYMEYCDFRTKNLWIHLKEGDWPTWGFSKSRLQGFDSEALELAGKKEMPQIVIKIESKDKDPVYEVCALEPVAFVVGGLSFAVLCRIIAFFAYLFV